MTMLRSLYIALGTHLALGVYNVLYRHSNIARIPVSYEELALDSMNMVLYGGLADSNVNT